MKTQEVLSMGIILVGVTMIIYGTYSYNLPEERCENKQIDGLWFEEEMNWSKVLRSANEQESGNWICVNIKNMSYDRAVEVCKHEVGHEMFSQVCEKDMNKCLEVMK